VSAATEAGFTEEEIVEFASGKSDEDLMELVETLRGSLEDDEDDADTDPEEEDDLYEYEDAGVPENINDKIVKLIEEWERETSM